MVANVPREDFESVNPPDPQWEQGFEVLVEIGAAFEGVDPDEIERETAKALAEARAEMRREADTKERLRSERGED